MINLNSMSLRRGENILINSANLTLHRKQHIGLTGANGSGKSSLLAMLKGDITPDSGDITIQGGIEIAHVAQETDALDQSAIDFVIDGDKIYRHIQRALDKAIKENNVERQAEWHAKLENINGYAVPSHAAKLLNGLGFKQQDLDAPVTRFSGGWRMRLNLAQALMCRSDLLLLDEPTNHLDMDAIIWLESWLKHYEGTLILISHDRDFLDSICTHIMHIEQQSLSIYTGNYSQFEDTRAQKLAQQQQQFEKQQRSIEHMQSFIDRFRAKATKAKQAQSRIKALERLSLLSPAHVDSPFEFTFLPPKKEVKHMLNISDAVLGYQRNDAILNNVELSISYGDCIGLLGPNGAGKSTLIKSLMGKLTLLSGKLSIHSDCEIAYFAQHQLEQLIDEKTPVEHLSHISPDKTESEIRDFLGGFGFSGDRANSKVSPFSGGEKARLVLSMLVLRRPNLLLLDEPTNHLDLDMRHALTIALQSFEGASILISHDRHLLRTVCDRLYTVFDGQFYEFDGDVDDYPAWLNAQTELTTSANPKSPPINNKKLVRQQEAQARQQLKPYRDAVEKSEQQIEKLQIQMKSIEEKLSDESLYQDSDRRSELLELTQQQSYFKNALEEMEQIWLETTDQFEIKKLALKS